MIPEEVKDKSLKRLNRARGQLDGLKKMIEDDRYCVDILTQISSVHEALRGLGKLIMQNFLESCVTNSITSEDRKKKEKIYEELMDIIYKFAK